MIEKPQDAHYLEMLIDDLPDEFDEVRFIEAAKKIAQSIRKFESRRANGIPSNEKLLNPEQQKRLLKTKLPKEAQKLHELLLSLPDEIKTRIDWQYLYNQDTDDDRFLLIDWPSFTEVVTDLVNQLNQCCENAYNEHNQGWRNPYKTQEAFLALEFRKASGKEIKTSKNDAFFYVLKAFINYCQVSDYKAVSVDETRILRILRQVS